MSANTKSTRSKSARVRLALSAVALLGIGAAITAAAWTDDVYFEANLTAGEVELKGSLNGGGFTVSNDGDDIALEVEFDLLVPGDERQFTVQVRNDSNVDVDVSAPEVTEDGAIFNCDTSNEGVEVVLSSTAAVGVLEKDETSSVITVTVTTGDDWAEGCQGATGNVVIHFTGTTDVS